MSNHSAATYQSKIWFFLSLFFIFFFEFLYDAFAWFSIITIPFQYEMTDSKRAVQNYKMPGVFPLSEFILFIFRRDLVERVVREVRLVLVVRVGRDPRLVPVFLHYQRGLVAPVLPPRHTCIGIADPFWLEWNVYPTFSLLTVMIDKSTFIPPLLLWNFCRCWSNVRINLFKR